MVVKRIQHSIQHLKNIFFDLDQTSSNTSLQMLDDPTWGCQMHLTFYQIFAFSILDETLDAFDRGFSHFSTVPFDLIKRKDTF